MNYEFKFYFQHSSFIITLLTFKSSASHPTSGLCQDCQYLTHRRRQLKQILIFLLIAVLSITFTPKAIAADTANGAQIFEIHCAGCHINGGNIIRRGKTLKQKALKKYGMDSEEAIANIVANGKNNMSAYKDRLSAQQIIDVSAYVLSQAQTDWRNKN